MSKKQIASWVDRSLEQVAFLFQAGSWASCFSGCCVCLASWWGSGFWFEVKGPEGAVPVWRAQGAPFGGLSKIFFSCWKKLAGEFFVFAFPTKKIRPWLIKANPLTLIHEGLGGVQAAGPVLLSSGSLQEAGSFPTYAMS